MKKVKSWRYWAKELLMSVIFITILSVAVDYWRQPNLENTEITDISGVSTSGKFIDVLEASNEKPVVVYFWATWCGACQFVTPSINWFGQNDSFDVVGVSLSSGSNQRVTRYLAAKDYDFENINDTNGNIARSWGISVTPTIAIIRNGQVTSITTGITTPLGIITRAWLAK